MFRRFWRLLAVVLTAAPASASTIPPSVIHALPPGYTILSNTQISTGTPLRLFHIIALGKKNENTASARMGHASARPLIIIEQVGNLARVIGRNDDIILKADEGGQCDPFLDGDAVIVAKGVYFTVENGVACGQHWTDYITFRFDRTVGFVFDNERMESWSMNKDNSPDAVALVRDGPQIIHRNRPGHLTKFTNWRPVR